MRYFINIIEKNLVESNISLSFEELALKYDTVDKFIRATDGKDVLYRGHNDNEVSNNSFMTDYVGHAEQYSDDGRVDAYAYNPADVLFFNDAQFDEMRNAYRHLDDQQLSADYKAALVGNRFADEFRRSFSMVKKIIQNDIPYSKICADPAKNDALVPLMQAYARKHGKNIIAFLGGDYADYGGQNEYVVGDVSKLTNLRKLYATVRARA